MNNGAKSKIYFDQCFSAFLSAPLIVDEFFPTGYELMATLQIHAISFHVRKGNSSGFFKDSCRIWQRFERHHGSCRYKIRALLVF